MRDRPFRTTCADSAASAEIGPQSGPDAEGSLDTSETTNNSTPADLPIDPYDGDDVEAHGLREVAAAGVIGATDIGAGGVALTSAHTPVPRTPAVVQQAIDDTNQLTGDARDGAQDLAGATAGDARTSFSD